jgi:hypothetical protein
MSRKLVVAALAAACLIGFGACGGAHADPSVKSSKSNVSKKTKGAQGQPVKTTTNNGTASGGRTDSEYGNSGPKGR